MHQALTALVMRRDIAATMVLGYTLSFLVTPILFVWYTATEQESYSIRRGIIPMVSDMFGDWPMLSSATMGIGMGLLFSSVLLVATTLEGLDGAMLAHVNTLVRLCIIIQASLWIVISTGTKNGETPIYVTVAHASAAFLFTSSCTWALLKTYTLCKSVSDYLEGRGVNWSKKTLSYVPVLFWLCVAAIAASVLGMMASIALGSESDIKLKYVWPFLASAELFITTLSWIGYSILMYVYYSMQSASGRSVQRHWEEHDERAEVCKPNGNHHEMWSMLPPTRGNSPSKP
jgi:hypothetical protein